MYIKRNTLKQKALLEQDKRIFRAADLAVLWRVENKNTLLTTIKRYIQRQVLYRLVRGVYSTVPVEKLHPFELGCAVAGPLAYLSLETVLVKEGIIFQQPAKITLVGKKTQEFSLAERDYWCRYMKPSLLVNREGIEDNGRMAVATAVRAVEDMRYFNPNYHFDNQDGVKQ